MQFSLKISFLSTCFGNITRIIKNYYPSLAFMNILMLPLWNLVKERSLAILPKRFVESTWIFLDICREISLLAFLLKQRCKDFSAHKMSTIYAVEVSVTVHEFSGWRRKSTLDFTEIVNNRFFEQESTCQIVRFTFLPSYTILKIFSQCGVIQSWSWLLKKKGVKHFGRKLWANLAKSPQKTFLGDPRGFFTDSSKYKSNFGGVSRLQLQKNFKRVFE